MMKGLTGFVLKGLVVCIIAGFLGSCKSSKKVFDGTLDENLSAKTIIRNHYKNQVDFRTLSSRVRIDYSDGESTQSVTVSLRIEKNKAIWISAPLGVVKAYITPERVSFYNKLQNEYFDGDFTYLSKLLGAELDFDKVQNLLLGQALFDLREGKYNATVLGGSYELKPNQSMEVFKTFFQLEPQHFRIATQQLSQPLAKRLLEIRYKNYQVKDRHILPQDIGITAIDTDNRNVIALNYRNIEYNKSLSFPYKIPNGFDEIVLK